MLILLDIDGVMVPAASWKPTPILDDGFPAFSHKSVANLNRILTETGASIVLTTSHKSSFSITEWQSIFKNRGLNVTIQKLDDNIFNLSRKDEILNWIDNKWSNENFVIIDDDKSLNGLPVELKEKLVLTRGLVGLDEDDTNSAISALKAPASVIA
jgi:hypothetical protein